MKGRERGQESRQIPKLIAPVRSLEGAVRVINAGADELYCGVTIPPIKDFMLYRGVSAEIPTYDELRKIVKYARSKGVEVTLTVNQPFMAKVIEKPYRAHILKCVDIGVDALMVGDMGMLSMIRDMDVDVSLYASTYTISRNYDAVDFLGKLGFERVILDRQLAIDEIAEIVRRSEVGIEVFIHGGGCSNTNGTCYLYHFKFLKLMQALASSKIGDPCTLPFDIHDLCEGEDLGKIEIMDAFEFCSLCKLPELMDAGVTFFKIVGRERSIPFQERTTKVYRELIDLLAHGQVGSFKEKLKSLRDEVFFPLIFRPLSLQEFWCKQGRCYYSHLSHAPYKIPLSWQAETKLQFKSIHVTDVV